MVLALYDRAIQHMEAGRFGIEHSDFKIQDANLQLAQKTVLELMSCLNKNQGGELAENLDSLYSYVLNELAEANLASRTEPVDRCLRMMSCLRQTWAEVETTTSQELPAAA